VSVNPQAWNRLRGCILPHFPGIVKFDFFREAGNAAGVPEKGAEGLAQKLSFHP
jgi:hypothetical protein